MNAPVTVIAAVWRHQQDKDGFIRWRPLMTHAGKKLARTPLVIGDYRTWPGVRAEFRRPSENSRTDYSLL